MPTIVKAKATDTQRLDWLLANTRVCQDWKWTGSNHPTYGDNNDLATREDIDRAIIEQVVRCDDLADANFVTLRGEARDPATAHAVQRLSAAIARATEEAKALVAENEEYQRNKIRAEVVPSGVEWSLVVALGLGFGLLVVGTGDLMLGKPFLWPAAFAYAFAVVVFALIGHGMMRRFRK